MHSSFATIGQRHYGDSGDNSFWPSFTDIMMVITMIFLMATSLLIVRNWQLVAELQLSVAAEQIAAQIIESTTEVNATLEERLTNAEQANSILRLRIMQKDEALLAANETLNRQDLTIATLRAENTGLQESLQRANTAITTANFEIESANTRYQSLARQLADLNKQLTAVNKQVEQQQIENENTLMKLDLAKSEIEALAAASRTQLEDIASLTQEKQAISRDLARYNQQLLTLKGEYEVVKSKYEELIRPARSAKGKYIAEVYYVNSESGKIIRYRQPGDIGFTTLPLYEVEKRLTRLKAEKGKELYVKIIIPENSGLSYNEAWNFMRNLLVKYDYYYQE